MKIASTAPIHLSNHEVLTHFLSLKADNDALQTAIAGRKARMAQELRRQYPVKGDDRFEHETHPFLTPEKADDEKMAERRGFSNELVWVQDQVIKYLCADLNPTARQTPQGVAKLADVLQDYGLVKGEILQICNLVPAIPVELYCIIEEVDLRFLPDPSEKLEAILNDVQGTLLETAPPHLLQYTSTTSREGPEGGQEEVLAGPYDMLQEQQMEQEFVHEAEWGPGKEEGIGEEVEGDMD